MQNSDDDFIDYLFIQFSVECTIISSGLNRSQELIINADNTYCYKSYKRKSWHKSVLKTRKCGKWSVLNDKLVLVCDGTATTLTIDNFDGRVFLIPQEDQQYYKNSKEEIESLTGETRLIKTERLLIQKYLNASSQCLLLSREAP